MLINLLMGLAAMTLCLFLQSALVLAGIRYYKRREGKLDSPSFGESLAVINALMLILVAGNLGQVAIWALLFQFLDEFQSFREAFYHSMVNFATLGYGDLVMSDAHKLLGPLEAINGVLMIGVSTATLMASFQDAMKRTVAARHGR